MHAPRTARPCYAMFCVTLAAQTVAWTVPVTTGAAAQTRAPMVDLTADGVAAAASTYVSEYQKAFASLLAEESSVQQLLQDGTVVGTRRLEGELFMTYVASDDEWIAVHDVATVDGRPVANREDLRRLLQAGDAGVIARVANRNAQFNIGTIIRNFNEPTLPLLLLSEKRLKHSRYRRVRMRDDGTVTVVTVSFEERERPTLIRSATGGAVFSKGMFVIEAGTGRVRETTLELEDGPVTATLVTRYAPDERLGLWVPVAFSERYERSHRGGRHEVVTAESTYTNYRRFEATGRIKREESVLGASCAVLRTRSALSPARMPGSRRP